jgi:DNA polymerase-3 subunit beta
MNNDWGKAKRMKFTINATDFRAALKAACEVAPSKGILPEYSCVFLQADEEGDLRIYARSESMEFTVAVPCDVQDAGEALIPSRMLLDYVSLAYGDVQISTDAKQKMTIKSGKKTSSIVGMSTDRFKAPAFSGEDILCASGADFAACLNRTSFCTSTDETRSMLCGVHLTIDSLGHIKFVGMDGYRISMCDMDKTDLIADLPDGKETTLPNAVLKLIPSLFSGEEKITFGLETYRASISGGGKTLIFPLMV